MLNLKTVLILVLVLVLVLGENIELSRENVIMLTSFNFSKQQTREEIPTENNYCSETQNYQDRY